jgi:hypothetical protein
LAHVNTIAMSLPWRPPLLLLLLLAVSAAALLSLLLAEETPLCCCCCNTGQAGGQPAMWCRHGFDRAC